MPLLFRTLAVLSLLLAATADAQPRAAVTFSAPEIDIITRYYHSLDGADAPRGRGANRLPRGIAKNLARGKPLPPGIAKRGLPPTLVAQLPPSPPGYERLVVAGKVLLIETATQIVHDVLSDVLFR